MSGTKRNYRDASVLRGHILWLLEFYLPQVIDRETGGYFGGIGDNGEVCDAATRHLVDTCRHIYSFSTATRLFGEERFVAAATHGLEFLTTAHRLSQGGFAWILDRREVRDATRRAYGHAFVLLAAAAATRAGIEGAETLLEEIWDLLESRFFEKEASLYVDEIGQERWSDVSPYRGQNANMHLCEAMLEAYAATMNERYLDRAAMLARRICLDLVDKESGMIWEHYHQDWSIDWNYGHDGAEHLFRPYGFQPGHFVEWAKLLVLLHRERPESWMLERARKMFDAAVERGWDSERGGLVYTFGRDGEILDSDRYYWALAEAIAGSALLADSTGDDSLWDWYERFWGYCDRTMVDRSGGSWHRVVDRDGRPREGLKSPPVKTDYHQISACATVLTALERI